MGAITARTFGKNTNLHKPEQKRTVEWETVGGALIGAVAFNLVASMAEKKFREKTEVDYDHEGEEKE